MDDGGGGEILRYFQRERGGRLQDTSPLAGNQMGGDPRIGKRRRSGFLSLGVWYLCRGGVLMWQLFVGMWRNPGSLRQQI